MSQPIPESSATLERHGIRGVEEPNLMRQIAPLNERYSALNPARNKEGQPRTDEEKLGIDLEIDLLHGLMGAGSTHVDEVPEVVTRAYRRTFDEWLILLAGERPDVSRQLLIQQLSVAWHNVEDLLKNSPRLHASPPSSTGRPRRQRGLHFCTTFSGGPPLQNALAALRR